MKKTTLERRSRFLTDTLPGQTKALPPDPEGRNASRARSAGVALEEFHHQTGADVEDAVSDLLANLMHWCDRAGQDFQQQLRRAEGHYAEETCSMSVETMAEDF